MKAQAVLITAGQPQNVSRLASGYAALPKRNSKSRSQERNSMNGPRDIVYYLPRDTAALLTPDRVNRCKNLGLILDKYPERMAIEKGDGRGQWLRELEPA